MQQAYRDRIGFEVSKELLKQAVLDTYALELDDMLLSTDLAIGTYRKAISTTIPEMTRIAWRDKRKEIEELSPELRRHLNDHFAAGARPVPTAAPGTPGDEDRRRIRIELTALNQR